jgi:lipoyl-dependent peroxiredoxin
MAVRKAEGTWEGTLKGGKGSFKGASGAIQGPYSFGTRFEEAPGTNPEELIAAAHASCFSMAFSFGLELAGFPAKRVHTTAAVTLDKVEGGFGITKITLTCDADVPNIDEAKFQELAAGAKKGCPISKALAAVPTIELNAKLVR